MKFGIRVPSFSKRIAARLSPARAIRHRAGLKVPRGAGWFTDPRRAAYGRVYQRTSVSVATRRGLGVLVLLAIVAAVVAFVIFG